MIEYIHDKLRELEEEIAKLRYDFDKLVEIFGCIADGYTELYLLICKIKLELKNHGGT
jgi:hypothetical protein